MTAVLVGRFGSETQERLRLACLRGHAEPAVHGTVEQAREALAAEDRPAPRCVFADAASPGIEAFVAWMRGEARLFSVPMVAMVPALDCGAFCEAHAFGADDAILANDDEGITRRLRNLAEFDPSARPPTSQGRAVVAHANMGRRRLLGRILRQGGVDVASAGDTAEMVDVAPSGETPSLIVAAHDIAPTGALYAVTKVRRATGISDLPFVLLGAARDLSALGREGDELGAVGVTSELAPPDNLLFLANELLRPDVENLRASERVLFGTMCGFRPAGELTPTYGLTYNLSREGMFVRTLDAPVRGTPLWLEMRPPRGEGAVHLRGEVVWSRGLSNGAGGATPPGFGLRIAAECCPPDDLAAYHAAYEGLRERPRLFG